MIIKDSKAFKIVLQNLQKFADKSNKLDALNYVKFFTTEGSSILTVEFSNFVNFSNTGMLFYYIHSINLTTPTTFTTVFFLHLSELKRLVAEMVNASKIQIEAEGLVLSGSVLKFVNSKRFTINEFPNFKQPELEWLPAPENFQQVLTNVEKFVNAKEDREFLGGTWWYVQDGKFSLMGVDGHIAYFHTFQEQANFTPFCVPLIAKFLNNSISTIGISKTHLQLVGQNFILTVQLPKIQVHKFWERQYDTPEYFILTDEILEKLPKKTEKFYMEQLPNGITEFRDALAAANSIWKFEAEMTCTKENYLFGINWNELQVIVKLLGDFKELQLNFSPIEKLGKIMIGAKTPLIINQESGNRKFYSMAVYTYSDQN
jgi:hypothetical protein